MKPQSVNGLHGPCMPFSLDSSHVSPKCRSSAFAYVTLYFTDIDLHSTTTEYAISNMTFPRWCCALSVTSISWLCFLIDPLMHHPHFKPWWMTYSILIFVGLWWCVLMSSSSFALLSSRRIMCGPFPLSPTAKSSMEIGPSDPFFWERAEFRGHFVEKDGVHMYL